MQVQTDTKDMGPVQLKQFKRAQEIKRRLYGGQSVEKNKIYQLTEEVKRLKATIAQVGQQTSDEAMVEIRELSNELQYIKEKHLNLIDGLKARGLGKLVDSALVDVDEVTPVIPAAAIMSAVSIVSKIGINDRHGERRQKHLVFWRSVEAWLMKVHTRRSYPSIGKALGGRDHSTIVHHVRKVNNNYDHYAGAISAVEELL